MGWFDTQLRQRNRLDNEEFENAFISMAESVMGSHEYQSFKDDKLMAQNAIEEVLKYYHIRPDTVPESVSDFYDILDYQLRKHGIMYRQVRLTEGFYKDAYGPMLAKLTDSESYVALIPGKVSGYHFKDELTGEIVKLNKKNESRVDKDAICFYLPFPQKKLTIGDLGLYMLKTLSINDLVFMIIISAVVQGFALLTPKIYQMIMSNVESFKCVSFINSIMVLFACTTISSSMFSLVSSLVNTRINQKLSLSIESAAMMRLLSLPPTFFKKYSSGELASRSSYLNSLCNMIVSTVLGTGLTSLFSLTYIFEIKQFAPVLILPSIVITLVTMAFSIISTFVKMKIDEQKMEIQAKESGMSLALVSGIQKIKLAGAEKRAFTRWANIYAKEADLTYNPPQFIKINSVISMAIGLAGTLVMYYLTLESKVSVADYYAFSMAYGGLSAAFMSLAGITLTVAQFKPILDMTKPLLETEPEVSENKTIVTGISGGVELNHVSFRYNDDSPMVLDDLSLKIDAGSYVAIVGKTGCGKSTLVRLLLGFEKPLRGSIFYDGRDLKTLDVKSLRKHIGVVMQTGSLFVGDIYSNIVISAPQLSMDDAWEAAEKADIADDIREMPMGMFTMIAEGQGGISGGQKQRLMIARAIAPKPKLVILDEATSALDNITQKKVSEAMDNLKCTRIVIAHRLSTIKQCDRILLLDGGHIIEEGTYDELMNKDGFFSELVKHQRIDG